MADRRSMPLLGRYPTPVIELARSAEAARLPHGASLWCKRDDLTSELYGGNKVRKLERILDDARARGAKRLVTLGAVGSHHVLATGLFGRAQGFEVEAVLAPQRHTVHAEEVARAAASIGVRAYPVASLAAMPMAIARQLGRLGDGAYLVPPGGSSPLGSMAYVDAALELAAQIARGELPRPACIVVALGSGGTAAGLLVGLERAGLLGDGKPPIELLAVQVVDIPFASAAATLSLALAIQRRLREPRVTLGRASIARMSRALRISRAFLGEGYGVETEDGVYATRIAASDGLMLDPTYTAKTFAGALAEARVRGPEQMVLFWHTLSAEAPFARLVASAPPASELPSAVRQLLRTKPPSPA